MKNKEDYINYANKTFKGKALELVLNNIELFYDNTVIDTKNKSNKLGSFPFTTIS